MQPRTTLCIACLLGLGCCLPSFMLANDSLASNALENAVQQILRQHCVRCHNKEKTRGGLDLSTRESLLQGGATADALVPGEPEKSPLYLKAQAGSMPPERDGRRLHEQELKQLYDWIAAGAAWPASTPRPEDRVEPVQTRSTGTTPSASCVSSNCRASSRIKRLRRR